MQKVRKLIALVWLLIAAPLAWSTPFEDARAQADAGNFAKAVEMLTPLVQGGDIRATGLLGFLLLSGQGITKNTTEAERLLNYSAEHGNAGAMAALAFAYWSGEGLTQNFALARQRAEQAAAQENPIGQYVLGSMKIASVSSESQAEGVELLQKSTQKGLPLAQYQMGKLTALGWIIARDKSAGLDMMEAAAKKTPPLAKFKDYVLALEPDYQTYGRGGLTLRCDGIFCAARWGANRNDASGFYRTAMWPELAGAVIKADYPEDLTYFYLAKAAEGMGFLDAAEIYYSIAINARTKCAGIINNCDGISLPGAAISQRFELRAKVREKITQDRQEAAASQQRDLERQQVALAAQKREELRLAVEQDEKNAAQGDAAAQRALAARYFVGNGVVQSPDKAVEWLEKAVAQNDADAMYELGQRKWTGKQVPQNEKEAEALLHKSQSLGNKGAADQLVQIAEARKARMEVQRQQRLANERVAAEAREEKARQDRNRELDEERKSRADAAVKLKSL